MSLKPCNQLKNVVAEYGRSPLRFLQLADVDLNRTIPPSKFHTGLNNCMVIIMDVDEPELAVRIHERIEEIDSARHARLKANHNRNGEDLRSRHETGRNGYEDREMSEASAATLQHKPQSRESTATMRGVSEIPNPQGHSVDAMDIDIPEARETSSANAKKPTVIVATDFGTTFSSVAFALCEDGRRPRVKMVANYPDDPRALQGRPSLEVPTESWYPDSRQLAELDAEMDMKFNNEEDVDLYGTSDQEREDNQLEDDPLEDGDTDSRPPDRKSRDFVWGYGIQKLTTPDMDAKQFDRIARSKLILDTSDHTQQVRNELRPVMNRLKRRKIIDQEVDVIADYLTRLFIHSKRQIQDALEISDSTPVEHVLCVPIVWSSAALRKMQKAMKDAIERSGLGTMENLFLVSEPEAAAAYVLGQSDEVNVSIPLPIETCMY